MRKFKLVLFLILSAVTVSTAQVKKKGLVTVSINTPGLYVKSVKVIEQFMTREEGVTKIVADFKRKTTKVTYWSERTNIENIKTAIANRGFDADDITANEEFAKKLPPCCKVK